MRAAFLLNPRAKRRDVTWGAGGRLRRSALLPPLAKLLQLHPSEDALPFKERVIFRLVSGSETRGADS